MHDTQITQIHSSRSQMLITREFAPGESGDVQSPLVKTNVCSGYRCHACLVAVGVSRKHPPVADRSMDSRAGTPVSFMQAELQATHHRIDGLAFRGFRLHAFDRVVHHLPSTRAKCRGDCPGVYTGGEGEAATCPSDDHSLKQADRPVDQLRARQLRGKARSTARSAQ